MTGPQHPAQPRPLGRVLAIINVLILGIIATAAAYALRFSYEAHTEQARQAAENLALTLSTNIASDIKQIDNVLLSTRMQVDTPGVDLRQVAAVAAQGISLVPQVEALRVTDARGQVLNTNGPAVLVSDRAYFKDARAAPGALAMSEPLQDRILGKWGLIFARARAGGGGEFLGIVFAHLSTEYFLRAFDDVRLGRHGAVSLRTTSLNLVARYTPGMSAPDASLGTNTVSAELRAALAADPSRGFYISRTAIDGIERANAYRKVEGYPLVIIVGLGTDDFYGAWKREVATTAAFAGLLAGMVVGLSLLAYRTQVKQARLNQDIHRLAFEQQALLDNELVGMVRLRDRKEVWHNRAMSRLFGYVHGELAGHHARLLHADDESYERIGQAYAVLNRGEQFRTQLQMRHKAGHLIWIDLSGVRLSSGESLWMMVDITALKESESQALHMALHDPLTGLANRAGLDAELTPLLEDARREGQQVAFCFVDLDGFKSVNDAHGHEAGDALLRMAARRIASCTRAHDLVVRLGGDEFVLVLTHVYDASEAEPVLQRVLEALAAPFSVSRGFEVHVGASLGVALFPQDGSNADELLAKADAAMYTAKRAGKGQFSFHPPASG